MDKPESFLPFALPDIGPEEIEAVAESLRSGWVTTGPRAKAFEEEFAALLEVPEAVAVNSATAGLHLALQALGIGPGDQVLTTTNTFTATAEVVRYLGAYVVLADIDFDTMNLSPESVRQALEDLDRTAPDRAARLKAMIPVHFGGQACPMPELLDIARERGMLVVEDAAHALPCTCGGRPAGTMGDVGVFSFYATKTMTTGEGGMAVTADRDLAARMRRMRLHGISREVWDRYVARSASWYYEVVAPGFKYNLPDPAAAMGRIQLRRLSAMWERRRAIADRYLQAFAGDPRLVLPRPARTGDVHSWHLFVVRLARTDRDRFVEGMARRGIGTSVHFIPLHLHPYWRDRYGFRPEQFPVALRSYRRSVSLPIYSRMDDGDVDRVIRAVFQSLDEAEE